MTESIKTLRTGDSLEINSTKAAFKLTLKFEDGTEVSVDMGPGSNLRMKAGRMQPTVIIDDPDRPVGHLDIV